MKRRDPTLPVVVISGHGNIETAVTAIKRGASDFLEKPFEANELVMVVARTTETERLRRANETLRTKVGLEEELTGNSAAINNVRARSEERRVGKEGVSTCGFRRSPCH